MSKKLTKTKQQPHMRLCNANKGHSICVTWDFLQTHLVQVVDTTLQSN